MSDSEEKTSTVSPDQGATGETTTSSGNQGSRNASRLVVNKKLQVREGGIQSTATVPTAQFHYFFRK